MCQPDEREHGEKTEGCGFDNGLTCRAARWHMGSRVQLSKMGSPHQLYDGSPRCTSECGDSCRGERVYYELSCWMRSRCLGESGENLPPFAQFAAGSSAKPVPAAASLSTGSKLTRPVQTIFGIGCCWQGRGNAQEVVCFISPLLCKYLQRKISPRRQCIGSGTDARSPLWRTQPIPEVARDQQTNSARSHGEFENVSPPQSVGDSRILRCGGRH